MSFTSLEFFQVHQELLIGWSMGGENDRMVVTMVAVGKRKRGAA
jgi:hypothetical protein